MSLWAAKWARGLASWSQSSHWLGEDAWPFSQAAWYLTAAQLGQPGQRPPLELEKYPSVPKTAALEILGIARLRGLTSAELRSEVETGSSHKFIFGSMVGAMCFPASAFQVKALARLMLWDKSRMRLPGDWTCSSGSASCSLSVKVLYHELLETLGCAPWPHLTRKDSAIFMWWSAHSVLEGFSCWLSSSRRCIRWVKSASTAGSSSAKRASEAQGPCLTHPDKRPPNAEKMDPRFYPGRTAKDLLPPTPKRRTSAGGVQASQTRCCLWGQAGLRTHGLPFGCMRNTSMLDWPPVFPLHAKENKNFSHGISQSKRKQVSISFVIYVNWKLILDYIASNHCCTASDIGISLYFIA